MNEDRSPTTSRSFFGFNNNWIFIIIAIVIIFIFFCNDKDCDKFNNSQDFIF
jgi:hypothetical protein